MRRTTASFLMATRPVTRASFSQSASFLGLRGQAPLAWRTSALSASTPRSGLAMAGAGSSAFLCATRRYAVSPYGTIPADVENSRDAKKPLEEEVQRVEDARRRREQGGPTAEEAHAEAITSQVAGYNPWEVLGLKAGASNQTIRLRYHELMKEVHPDLAANGGDIPRLNQINKAYELITKSPTLDKRYRNLVSDTQYVYYRFLPEWMAKNVDEMPRYWSWVKWRTGSGFHVFLLLFACYAVGRFYVVFPRLTTVCLLSVLVDVLFHTMIAPATLSILFLYSIMAYRSYDMAWLTSPKGFLRRELGY